MMPIVPGERSLPPMGYSTEDSSIRRLAMALDSFASSSQTDAPSIPQISVSSVHTSFPMRYSEMQSSGSVPPSPSISSQGWQQLLGEVAFQLDRRILAYVFPHRSRFYGFTVTNIFEKIVEMAMASLSGGFVEQRGLAPARRFLELMGRLQSLGYSPKAHPGLSESLINAYGLLPEPLRLEERGGPAFLQRLLRDSLPPDLRHDANVLLECLLQMARDDGMPIFLW
ncbi:speriolin-like [Heliangelus exortis]|uniref:speriolin-like n=1 Tax=Heliangelus exortis TaxID=472823 RepID=UPI003A90A7BF